TRLPYDGAGLPPCLGHRPDFDDHHAVPGKLRPHSLGCCLGLTARPAGAILDPAHDIVLAADVEAGRRHGGSPRASVASSSIWTLPRSALETGHAASAASAICRNVASSSPATWPRVSRRSFVIL